MKPMQPRMPNDDRDRSLDAISAPLLAESLEQTQIAKYQTPGGHGFAAEDANHLNDALKGKRARIVGTSNELNGADRLVDGLRVQSKYFRTAGETLAAAFDSVSGSYRYTNQVLEVPFDQYEQCVELMRGRIEQGRVPGFSDPAQAEKIVQRGSITYKQARNIARAGNIDSLIYDAKQHAVTSSYVFAASFAVMFAHSRWRGEGTQAATRSALTAALSGGATTLITGVVSTQLLRTQAAATGVAAVRGGVNSAARTSIGRGLINRIAAGSLGKSVYGAAARNHVAKLVRSNTVTTAVAAVITITPDFYRAAFTRSISWRQFARNSTSNLVGTATGAAGWLAGAAAGATVGSAVPIVGTAAGGLIGGIAGALGGGYGGATAANTILDRVGDKHARVVLSCIEEETQKLAFEYLFTEDELEMIRQDASAIFDRSKLRELADQSRQRADRAALFSLIREKVEPHFEAIAKGRPTVSLPASQELAVQLSLIAKVMDA